MIEKFSNDRILSLDLGDAWTGVALSDVLKTLAKPYKTIPAKQLSTFLHDLLKEYNISTIVIGYPITLKGTQSAQTDKVLKHKEQLEQQFHQVKWVLWDERFSSKQAAALHRGKKKSKFTDHAFAAAFILQSYLDHLHFSF